MKCREIVSILDSLSPRKYACNWDNVGLLVGRAERDIKKIMIALDASKEVIKKAVEQSVDMLITHHPMIFSPIQQVNEEEFTSEKVLDLAENGICYYAMHTNFDAVGGMAELIAGPQYLNLSDVSPIDMESDGCREDGEGMGRYGKLSKPMTAKELADFVKQRFQIPYVVLYQDKTQQDRQYTQIAVMPGSGKSCMKQVVKNGYDLYVTGDYGHHDALDAIDMGLTVIDATHYGLERIFISYLSGYLCGIIGESVEIVEMDMGCPGQII